MKDIRKLEPPAKGNKVYYDAPHGGFGMRVTAAGAKSFIFNYRVRGTGRQRRFTIGGFPAWSLSAARAKARQLRRLIDEGGDPLGDIEAAREAPTMAQLTDRFIAEHVEPRTRAGTARAYKALLGKHIRPYFGAHRKVVDVAFEDIDALHRRITGSGSTYAANRCVSILSKMFALAVKWRMRNDNPCKGIERNPESKRKRYLSSDELARLVRALAAHPDQWIADIIRLLLLTGARRGEVLSMRWADVDLGKGVWSKPASTTKQKSDHIAPLSAPARQLLAEVRARQAGKPQEFVFPSSKNDTGHIVDLERAWRTICKAAEIGDLRVHDLRHSFASQLVSGGASLPLIGALLGHANPATTSRYAHLHDDPQRAAVERVGATIINAGKGAEEPVNIEGGRRGRRR